MGFTYLITILLIIILNLGLRCFLSLPTISFGLLGASALLIKTTQYIITKTET